jgi:hypothetical protein
MPEQEWYAVRCVFRHRTLGVYEERITLWRAESFAGAAELAEAEAEEYCADLDETEYVGFAQSYALYDVPGHGAEVFSLMRDSALEPEAYVERFFDTGEERTGEG